VYSFARYKNWDQVDADNVAAELKVSLKAKDTVGEGVTVSPSAPCSVEGCRCPCHNNNVLEPFGIHMIYLDEGFAIRCLGHKDTCISIFDTQIVICHFRRGGERHRTTWKTIIRNYMERYDTDSPASCLYKIDSNSPALEHSPRQASISRDHKLRESIEYIWALEDQVETWVVADQSLVPETPSALQREEPSMRGGGGGKDLHTDPVHSEAYIGLAEEFDCLYHQLVLNTLRSCGDGPTSVCTKAWMSVAKILQLRNKYLKRQLEELKEMHNSVV
jgi:hypothetical protein